MLKGTIYIPGQNRGTTTNDNAAAGDVGEYITSQVAANGSALTSGATANVTSISLTAGDWDVGGIIDFLPAATTSITELIVGTNTTSATIGAQDTYLQDSFAAEVPGANQTGRVLPTVRWSLASTTTIFLVVFAIFTVSTLNAWGTIRARRVR